MPSLYKERKEAHESGLDGGLAKFGENEVENERSEKDIEGEEDVLLSQKWRDSSASVIEKLLRVFCPAEGTAREITLVLPYVSNYLSIYV